MISRVRSEERLMKMLMNGDELELTATDEIPQDEDPDMVDLMDRSNFEDDDDSRINSER